MHWHLLQPKSAVIVPIHHLLPEAVNAPANTTNITAFPEIAPAAASVRQATNQDSYSFIAHWKEWVLPAYLLVSAIFLLRLFVGLALALRIWHRAEATSVLLDPRANEVRISNDIQTPVTIGSSIILPASYEEWDQHKLHMVLAHERSHVHQGDFYLQFIAGVYASLFWFSPLGWWLKKEISDLGEAISDRAALKEAQSRATYAEVLVEFAAIPRRPLAGVAMARSSNIRRRVDRLLIEQNSAAHLRRTGGISLLLSHWFLLLSLQPSQWCACRQRKL
jgi:beta-lactamase regulating signal transducer with metallopeptidase domain